MALILCTIGSAHARQDGALAESRDRFEAGIRHYNVGEYREALVEFKAGYFAKRDPVFLFNLGQCYRQLGDSEAAARQYRAFLRESPDTPNRADVEKFIAAADADLQRRVANLPPTQVNPPDVKPPVASGPLLVEKPADSVLLEKPVEPVQPARSRTWLWVAIAGAGVAIAAGAVALAFTSSDAATRQGTDPTARVSF